LRSSAPAAILVFFYALLLDDEVLIGDDAIYAFVNNMFVCTKHGRVVVFKGELRVCVTRVCE
jgi:hypothetical protein